MRKGLFPVGWSYCSSRRLLSVLVMYDVDILIIRHSEPMTKYFLLFFPRGLGGLEISISGQSGQLSRLSGIIATGFN